MFELHFAHLVVYPPSTVDIKTLQKVTLSSIDQLEITHIDDLVIATFDGNFDTAPIRCLDRKALCDAIDTLATSGADQLKQVILNNHALSTIYLTMARDSTLYLVSKAVLSGTAKEFKDTNPGLRMALDDAALESQRYVVGYLEEPIHSLSTYPVSYNELKQLSPSTRIVGTFVPYGTDPILHAKNNCVAYQHRLVVNCTSLINDITRALSNDVIAEEWVQWLKQCPAVARESHDHQARFLQWFHEARAKAMANGVADSSSSVHAKEGFVSMCEMFGLQLALFKFM